MIDFLIKTVHLWWLWTETIPLPLLTTGGYPKKSTSPLSSSGLLAGAAPEPSWGRTKNLCPMEFGDTTQKNNLGWMNTAVYWYVCTYIYIYIYIYIYRYPYLCLYLYQYIYIYFLHIYIHIFMIFFCIFFNICIYVYIYIVYVFLYLYLCLYLCLYLHLYLYIDNNGNWWQTLTLLIITHIGHALESRHWGGAWKARWRFWRGRLKDLCAIP